jgi:hypothetical protein
LDIAPRTPTSPFRLKRESFHFFHFREEPIRITSLGVPARASDSKENKGKKVIVEVFIMLHLLKSGLSDLSLF